MIQMKQSTKLTWSKECQDCLEQFENRFFQKYVMYQLSILQMALQPWIWLKEYIFEVRTNHVNFIWYHCFSYLFNASILNLAHNYFIHKGVYISFQGKFTHFNYYNDLMTAFCASRAAHSVFDLWEQNGKKLTTKEFMQEQKSLARQSN